MPLCMGWDSATEDQLYAIDLEYDGLSDEDKQERRELIHDRRAELGYERAAAWEDQLK